MNTENADNSVNRFQGVMLCILSVIIFLLSPYATELWQKVGSVMFGLLIMAIGIWFIRTDKINWSPTEGFTQNK